MSLIEGSENKYILTIHLNHLKLSKVVKLNRKKLKESGFYLNNCTLLDQNGKIQPFYS